jgi:hypothetical protein
MLGFTTTTPPAKERRQAGPTIAFARVIAAHCARVVARKDCNPSHPAHDNPGS